MVRLDNLSYLMYRRHKITLVSLLNRFSFMLYKKPCLSYSQV